MPNNAFVTAVDPDKLHEFAARIAKTGLSLEGHIKEIHNRLQVLKAACEDQRLDEFDADFRHVKKPVNELVVDLDAMYKELNRLEEYYRDVEKYKY